MAKVGRRGHASDLRILISSSAGTSMLDVSLRSKNCETLDDISHFFQKQYFDEVWSYKSTFNKNLLLLPSHPKFGLVTWMKLINDIWRHASICSLLIWQLHLRAACRISSGTPGWWGPAGERDLEVDFLVKLVNYHIFIHWLMNTYIYLHIYIYIYIDWCIQTEYAQIPIYVPFFQFCLWLQSPQITWHQAADGTQSPCFAEGEKGITHRLYLYHEKG